jgi:hypothetical protein
VLLGLGLPKHAMMAVDVDEAAMRDFEKKYPEVPQRIGDVAHALGTIKWWAPPVSIFLDFSSQVSDYTFNRVRAALQALRPGGVLACTFAVGREKNWTGPRESKEACDTRLQMVENFIEHTLGFRPKVLLRLRYISESMTGPGSSIMCVIVIQMARGKNPESAKLYTIGLQDLYRDIHRHRNNPNLRLLINCPEQNTEALRARIRAYPPPRVT